MLTENQHRLLLYIHERLRQTGVCPSFEEMKQALGLRSKSGVHRLITALCERGFLRRLPNRARALEVLRLPDDLCRPGTHDDAAPGNATPGDATPGAAAPIDFAAAQRARTNGKGRAAGIDAGRGIPLVGRIAAGLPIEAIEEHEELAIPSALLGGGAHYALQVVGDSMIDAGIFDGDFALIEQTARANDGEIVVALIDSANATLKYLHHERGRIRLDPANPRYQPQYYAPARVAIQGRLAGLLRRY